MPQAPPNPNPSKSKAGGNERPAERPSNVREPSPVRPPDEPTPRHGMNKPAADEEEEEKDVVGG